MSPNLIALLPEYILTIVGVLIMLAEPLLPPAASRKPLGWLAILGTAGRWLLQAGTSSISASFTAFSGTIQIDAFSVFFHLLISRHRSGHAAHLAGLLRRQHAPLRRVLRSHRLQRRRHDADDLRDRTAGRLRRPRDLLHRDLHHVRLPQGPARPAPSPPSSTSCSAPSRPPSSSTASRWPSEPPAPPASRPSPRALPPRPLRASPSSRSR